MANRESVEATYDRLSRVIDAALAGWDTKWVMSIVAAYPLVYDAYVEQLSPDEGDEDEFVAEANEVINRLVNRREDSDED